MTVVCESLSIPEVKVLRPTRYGDNRGFFSEAYSQTSLSEAGIDITFVQDNHSLSAAKGTMRGLHFQTPPFAQDKLVRVPRGAIFDVAVDLRVGSPTFGKHVSTIVSADEWNQILIPIGFAHGLVTLEPDTEVLYKVSSQYSADCDKGVLWNDPAIGIEWPINMEDAVLSEKDKIQPTLAELPQYFTYEE
jgi:dTDP-4-dehydrorhamnose 3,5-epimerase